MIINTSTIQDIHVHLDRYNYAIQERMLRAIEGHAGRALRKGNVSHWPCVMFARFVYDHNTYTAAIGYKTKRDFKNGNAYTGVMVEYESDFGKQLATIIQSNSQSVCVLICNHAISRVRERMHWDDVDWYTLVQRITVMMDGAMVNPNIHRYGDVNEITYGCPKGEFCGLLLDKRHVVIRTFIGKEQQAQWRKDEHAKYKEWFDRNRDMLHIIKPEMNIDALTI